MNGNKTLQEEYNGVSLVYMNNDTDGGNDWRWFIGGHRTTAGTTKEDCIAFLDSDYAKGENKYSDGWNAWLASRAIAKGGPRTDLLRRLADGLREAHQGSRLMCVGGSLSYFDMNDWGSSLEGHVWGCGYAGCAIGHAPAILGNDCPLEIKRVLDSLDSGHWFTRPVSYGMSCRDGGDYEHVADAFDMQESIALYLFDPDSYGGVGILPDTVADRIDEFCNKWEAAHG